MTVRLMRHVVAIYYDFTVDQQRAELQRLERNGALLDGTVPVVLKNPAYRTAMLPP